MIIRKSMDRINRVEQTIIDIGSGQRVGTLALDHYPNLWLLQTLGNPSLSGLDARLLCGNRSTVLTLRIMIVNLVCESETLVIHSESLYGLRLARKRRRDTCHDEKDNNINKNI